MRILQLSPSYFSDSSVIGGGERYPTELARFESQQAEVRLVSFGKRRSSESLGKGTLEIYPVRHFLRGSQLNPFSLQFLTELPRVDVIHAHQISTMATDLACLGGKWLGKKVYLTDHGGGAEVILHKRWPWIHDSVTTVLQSEYARNFIPRSLRSRAVVIKGGVDQGRFFPDPLIKKNGSILFVGRILPHKGINDLIEAFRQLSHQGLVLKIVGRMTHPRYAADLQNQAQGLPIEFISQASDAQIVELYRQAELTVLPSVYEDLYGNHTDVPELMGFTLLESQACGTPVICTRAGAMPEFVRDGVTGRIVAPNSPKELAEAIRWLLGLSPSERFQMTRDTLDWVESFGWEQVAASHLRLYKSGK